MRIIEIIIPIEPGNKTSNNLPLFTTGEITAMEIKATDRLINKSAIIFR